MSGGAFDYDNYKIDETARLIQLFLDKQTDSDWDKEFLDSLRPETVAVIKDAVYQIEKAAILAHRIDYLLSGDDGEDSFHRRIKEDLETSKNVTVD